MSKSANEVRVGNIIEHQGKRWRVLKSEHVKPGKGGAFCQMELKEITQGTKLNERFRSTENLNVAYTEVKDYQYLFHDSDRVTLMDGETYEQIEINPSIFDGKDKYLQDGMIINIDLVEGDITGARVPQHVIFEITEAEAVVKGQTASGSNKPSTLENGMRLMVPQFIATGDKVVVNTEEDTYVKRAD